MSNKNDPKVKGLSLFTTCMGCGVEYEVKEGEKIDKLMFCTIDCANNYASTEQLDSPIMYDQDGIALLQ